MTTSRSRPRSVTPAILGRATAKSQQNDLVRPPGCRLTPDGRCASATLDGLIAQYDIEISADGSVLIENRSPDIGLSPPNSAWMTFFGQFFDHGLDLVTKGGNGTIYMPLQSDDPLIAGADDIFGTTDDLPRIVALHDLVAASTPFERTATRATALSRRTPPPLRRPEPDLYLQCLAPGLPARVQIHRGYERERRGGFPRNEHRPLA